MARLPDPGTDNGQWGTLLNEFLRVAHNPDGTPANVVATLADLRNLAATGTAFLLGYYAPGDGGGGQFRWDAAATEPDNGGTVIPVTGLPTGRWKRLFATQLNVREFGARGDGITLDTLPLQATINAIAAAGGGTVLIPPGNYLVHQSLIIPSFVTVAGTTNWNLANSFSYIAAGDSPGFNVTRLTLAAASNCPVFVFAALTVSSGLSRLFINGNKANQASGAGIVFTNDSVETVRGSHRLEQLYVYGCKDAGIVVPDRCHEVYLDKVYADRCGGTGISIAGQDCSLTDVLAGYNGQYGIEVTSGGALRSYNCDVFGNILAGLYVHDVKSCRFIGLQSNGNYQEGVLIARASSYSPSRLQFVGCSFFGNSVEYTTSALRYAELRIATPSGGGAYAVLLDGCVFGIYGGTTHCSHAIADTSPTVRVNAIVGCQFESTVYSTSLFNGIAGVYQIYGCSDAAGGLPNSIASQLHTETKVNNVVSATESLGYDYRATSFTVDPSKRFTTVNAFSAPVTVTLPPANTLLPGKELIVRKHDVSANVITVVASGTDAFGAGTPTTLTTQGQVRRYISDGAANWFNAN